MLRSLVFLLSALLLVVSCEPEPSEEKQPAIPALTSAYFAPDSDHPERSLLPIPTVLSLNGETDPPTLNLLDSQCYAAGSATERTLRQLETLNGFGTYSGGSIQAFFGAALDPDSLAGRVVLVDLGTFDGDGGDADLEHPIPVVTTLTKSHKYIDGCAAQPAEVDTLVVVPFAADTGLPVVLKGNHHYAVALLSGILDARGKRVQPFYVWSMVRQKEDIQISMDQFDYDQMARLAALRHLQNTYRPVLDSLEQMGHKRQDILLAWSFNTQSIDAPLEHIAQRLGTYGEPFDSTGVSLPIQPLPPQVFLENMGLSCAAIGAPGCPGIGTIVSGTFRSPNFQQMVPLATPYAPLPGGDTHVPSTFTSPTRPQVQGHSGQTISFLASTPAQAPGPYPVVIFQHPLTPTDPVAATRVNKSAMLALANTLGAYGIAVVAIDSVLAGDRAIMVTDSRDRVALYPMVNTDVFVTRDNIRQTAVDLLQLVRVLKQCSVEECGLDVDPQQMHFIGTSMGSIIGSSLVRHSSDIKKAVFNAPGAGLIDLFTQSPMLAPELFPTLCQSGVVSAPCCSDQATSCTVQHFAGDEGFAQFKVSAQWAIDPGDPINAASYLKQAVLSGDMRILLQQAQNDDVFPNNYSALLADLIGLAPDAGFLTYDPGDCGLVPGGAHSMLLQNCGAGSQAMQTDIVTFMVTVQ